MGDNNCESHFLAHEQSINEAKRDIDALYKTVNGIPNDIQNILGALVDIKKSIDKSDDKYVSKEVMELKLKNMADDIKLWLYGAVAFGVFSLIVAGLQYFKH